MKKRHRVIDPRKACMIWKCNSPRKFLDASGTDRRGIVNIMVAPRYLSKAPIVEAIIQFRVKLPPGTDHSKLLSTHEMLKEQYPKIQTRRTSTLKFEDPGGGKSPMTEIQESSVTGYWFTSSDDKQIVQSQLDFFAFSRLYPYETWEKARDEAKRLWAIYTEIVSPIAVKRVALRYINRLEIPMDLKDFGEYLAAPPSLPPALPQALSGFLTRIVVIEPSLEATAIITQALQPPANPKTVPVILDIDVFREADYDPKNIDIWDYLEKLHDYKNKIFFESITDKIVEAYL